MQFSKKMVMVIGDMLLTAASDADAARPFFPIKLILPAIYKAQGSDASKQKEVLWNLVGSCIKDFKSFFAPMFTLVCMLHPAAELLQSQKQDCRSLAVA